jgi:hypothetical protein
MTGTDPILPPGIRVGSGFGLDDRPVVRVDLVADLPSDGRIEASVVVTPRQARALAALLLKQADLVEGRDTGELFRVIEGRG